ncbi:MAG: hypothetical protein KDJ17_08680, partial [Hyphomicrobiaceae bacterium]|nr:hypothetical protein [Hyphomicrobiaceae bacterium]
MRLWATFLRARKLMTSQTIPLSGWLFFGRLPTVLIAFFLIDVCGADDLEQNRNFLAVFYPPGVFPKPFHLLCSEASLVE